MTLVEINASFSPGGHPTQVDRHKLIASSCIFVKFTTFCVNLQPTCESVWSPIASPYASSGFANVDLRVRLASGLTRIQPLPLLKPVRMPSVTSCLTLELNALPYQRLRTLGESRVRKKSSKRSRWPLCGSFHWEGC